MSRCYSQLTLADRRRLHHFVERKVPINEMARQLGRHRSTIYREIRRNTFRDDELPEYSGYFSTVADDIANHVAPESHEIACFRPVTGYHKGLFLLEIAPSLVTGKATF